MHEPHGSSLPRPGAAAPAEDRNGDHARAVRAWCLYDWANSAFATTMMAAMYPPFFRTVAEAAGMAPAKATAAWGYTVALALVVVAFTAPLLGSIADHTGRRKALLAAFTGLGVLATAATVTVGTATWMLAAGLFVLAQIGFSTANVFYESLLPGLAQGPELDRISARGYAWGYLGGGLLLVVNALWVIRPHLFGIPDTGAAVRASFASVAVWWAAFSLPLFHRVPEPPADRCLEPRATPLRAGLRRLGATFAELRTYRQLLIFLAAFWIYNDGISTVFRMATAFGSEIGIGLPHLIGALILTQFIGYPSSLAFGRLGASIGPRRAVLAALTVYVGISLAGLAIHTAWQFYALAAVVGTVQGGSQALSRSLFASMVPRHKTAEFFGFYGASSKFAGIFGPLVFAVVSDVTGSGRHAIFALVAFFLIGGALLTRVDEDEGRRVARDAERRHEARDVRR